MQWTSAVSLALDKSNDIAIYSFEVGGNNWEGAREGGRTLKPCSRSYWPTIDNLSSGLMDLRQEWWQQFIEVGGNDWKGAMEGGEGTVHLVLGAAPQLRTPRILSLMLMFILANYRYCVNISLESKSGDKVSSVQEISSVCVGQRRD